MLIDWFTVGAQAFNFFVLVGLMWRFLYKPVLHAIDAREASIAQKLAEAQANKTEAQKEHEEFAQKNVSFAQEREALWQKAVDEVTAERERLLAAAGQAADKLTGKRLEACRDDIAKLNQAIARRIQEEVLAIARKLLLDLAGVSLEARISEVFTDHLRALSGNEKNDFATALRTTSYSVLVRSTLALSAEQQTTVRQALHEIFEADMGLRFELTPDLICGIELIADGHKVAWSIADYLGSLEKELTGLVSSKEKSSQEKSGQEKSSQEKADAGLEAQPEPSTASRQEASD